MKEQPTNQHNQKKAIMEQVSPEENDRLLREQKIASNIPGMYSNRFFVFMSNTVKLSFLEVTGTEPPTSLPQASVVMTREDAKQLNALLGALLSSEDTNAVGASGR